MPQENNQPSNNTDVAMFIDWENMHGFIRGKANISALKEVAEGYGRLVLARAYADWREKRFQPDSLVLYKIGVEPIYVPDVSAGVKNNVDVKLATDCIDYAYRYPNIGVFILVTGDGDFIHVVSALRPLGKIVVAIAQSNNASSRLGDLVDKLLIYDQDVNPESSIDTTPVARPKKQKKPNNADKVYKKIVNILQQEDGSLLLLSEVKQRLVRMDSNFDQKLYGFAKFKGLVENGAKKGHFKLNTAGLRDWVTLPQKDKQTATSKLPDEIDKLFKEIVIIIKSAPQSELLLSNIKPLLVKKHGGFDESVYGFGRLKEMMLEGERLGYFKIGKNNKKVDYVYLTSKELK